MAGPECARGGCERGIIGLVGDVEGEGERWAGEEGMVLAIGEAISSVGRFYMVFGPVLAFVWRKGKTFTA